MPNFEHPGKLTPKAVRGPIPSLEFKFLVNWTEIPQSQSFVVIAFQPYAELSGVPLPIDLAIESRFSQFASVTGWRAQGEYSFRVLLPQNLIWLINAVRPGDVKGRIEIRFRYLVRWEANPPRREAESNAHTVEWVYSRDDWNALLAELGYEPTLVVELPMPTLPAWDGVRRHLEDASRAYREMDATALTRACRAAWLAAKPEIGRHWQRTKEIIDRSARRDADHLTKSERVDLLSKDLENLLGSSRYLADTAGHPEAHEPPSWREAVLIYQLTLSLLGYVSTLAFGVGAAKT